jgi:hypothetical protein
MLTDEQTRTAFTVVGGFAPRSADLQCRAGRRAAFDLKPTLAAILRGACSFVVDKASTITRCPRIRVSGHS